MTIHISSHLLLALVKAELKKSDYNHRNLKECKGVDPFQVCLKELLDVPEPLTQNQNVNELLLHFDD